MTLTWICNVCILWTCNRILPITTTRPFRLTHRKQWQILLAPARKPCSLLYNFSVSHLDLERECPCAGFSIEPLRDLCCDGERVARDALPGDDAGVSDARPDSDLSPEGERDPVVDCSCKKRRVCCQKSRLKDLESTCRLSGLL